MHFEKLTSKSVTHLSGLLQKDACRLKYAPAISTVMPQKNFNPAARFGSIIHNIVEQVVKDKLQLASFENVWTDLTDTYNEELKIDGFERFLPIQQHYPNFEIQKYRCLHLLNYLLKNYCEHPGTEQIQAEVPLECPSGKLKGFADLLVKKKTGELILMDYKTNNPVNEKGHIKLGYEWQLKIYASIFHDMTGRFPNHLRLIDLKCKEHSLAFNQEECKQLHQNLLKKLADLEDTLKTVTNPNELAKPNQENCRFCNKKITCDAYWRENESINQNQSWDDVRGNLSEEPIALLNGKLRIRLQKGSDYFFIRSVEADALPRAALGEEIAVMNVKKDTCVGHFVFTTLSRIVML